MDDARTPAGSGESEDLDLHFLIDIDGTLFLAKAIEAYDDSAVGDEEEKAGVGQARDLFEQAGTRFSAIHIPQQHLFSGQRTGLGQRTGVSQVTQKRLRSGLGQRTWLCPDGDC